MWVLEAWPCEHNVIAANFIKQQIDDELMLWKLLEKKYLIGLRRIQETNKKLKVQGKKERKVKGISIEVLEGY